MRGLLIAVVIGLAVSFASGQEPASPQKEKPKDAQAECPMHEAHSHAGEASSDMNARGEKGMGFSQTATTHHFYLKPDGGAIQAEASDPADAANRDNIRMHLAHIAKAFTNGDFAIPMFVHDTTPPGVPDMKRLRGKIMYTFEETPTGGRVVIATTDREAVAAVQQFLRFQIEEHKTGDSTAVHLGPASREPDGYCGVE